ncbi:glycosyltransferase [Mesobaculum littorinae]|uniref:Glycosyltransferase n=1 Tax=Mesobaculum littorinae TaxID=2486419 RepID=A0A438AI08_9RHOB|nr:glycosyltransferase [Mesobaculum littorinae]RVV98322.1 glycosyltransferase [Mesobaculum littorinae]
MNWKTDDEIMKNIARIRDSGLCDEKWYLETYQDVAALGMDPVEHYVKYGAAMLRDPNPDFSTEFYLNTHKTVKKNNLDPFLHYLTRKPQPHLAPDPAKVLWAASLDADAGHDTRAIRLADEHLSEKTRHTLSLLKANAASKKRNFESWRDQVNEFLTHFDLAPIKLKGYLGSLFERLTTSELPKIQHGPLVTVIMPAWNAASTIEYAVRSILNQTWQPVQLIIVDDASTDTTWQIIKTLAAEDDRILPLRNTQNVGPYVSKNIALKYAQGLWVTGHDADDWAHPQRLESHIKFLTASKKTASLMGMVRMTGSGKFCRFSPIGKNTADGACVAGFISMMCDRIFLDQRVGHWDEMRFGGDSELIHRLEASLGDQLPRFHSVGMFCLDNPDGLTNHPQFGHGPGGKVAKERRDYKTEFQKWHQSLSGNKYYLDFPQRTRRFPAPESALNTPGKAAEVFQEHVKVASTSSEREVSTDICVITDLRFPGGNASSTIDELKFFQSKGLNITLIHCPVDRDLGKPISERYYEFGHLIKTFGDFSRLACKTLIVRSPGVIVSQLFQAHESKVHANSAYFVINNSQKRTSGEAVYSIADMVETIDHVSAEKKEICPISPVMRRELCSDVRDHAFSGRDWTPTFDLESYNVPPRAELRPPYRIGRHGRDGGEKWLEDKYLLLSAYPTDDDFHIEILGGAKNAARILGALPANWTVHEFGSISPKEYLQNLDAFVYFPNTSLNEGFGRTIVEAMIAGIPCILPSKFEEVFANLAFYCKPEEVAPLIRELARHEVDRIRYLNEVQKIVENKFSSDSISTRLPEWSWANRGDGDYDKTTLSSESDGFRLAIMEKARG